MKQNQHNSVMSYTNKERNQNNETVTLTPFLKINVAIIGDGRPAIKATRSYVLIRSLHTELHHVLVESLREGREQQTAVFNKYQSSISQTSGE